MISKTLDLSGLDKRLQQLRMVINIDASALMVRWMLVLAEDNRRGILQGLDGFGVPMAPVTYRPKTSSPIRLDRVKSEKLTQRKTLKGQVAAQQKQAWNQHANAVAARMRKGQGHKAKAGDFQGGINGNLTSSEYRLLGGPPLAPRSQFSRVITNFKTTYTDPRQGGKDWAVIGGWDDVISTKGAHFLPYHFVGSGKLPRRDLRGIRPTGMAKCLDALRNWARLAIREHFT